MRGVGDSLLSYGIGIVGLLVSLVGDLETLTLLVSFLVLLIRLVYDAVRLWRYLTKGSDEE
jgi:hypothetical protein